MMDRNAVIDQLRSLGDFDDPAGLAVTVQTDALEQEIRAWLKDDPDAMMYVDADGPPRRIADVRAECDADIAAVEALARAWEAEKKKAGGGE